MELPFTVEEFLAAVAETTARPENAVQVRTKPRASSIAKCAKQIAFPSGIDWDCWSSWNPPNRTF